MTDLVNVTIPVDAEVAGRLQDSRNREAIGRIISKVLSPKNGPGPLAKALAAASAEAREAGLTDVSEIDAELAAFKKGRDADPSH